MSVYSQLWAASKLSLEAFQKMKLLCPCLDLGEEGVPVSLRKSPVLWFPVVLPRDGCHPDPTASFLASLLWLPGLTLSAVEKRKVEMLAVLTAAPRGELSPPRHFSSEL